MKKVKGLQYAEYNKGKNGNPNSYHLFNQVYEINVYLVVGQAKRVLNTWPHTEGYLDNDGCTFFNRDDQPVIWIREKGSYDTLSHELIHAISYIFKKRGLHFDLDNDESAAFLMSWLFRGFYFALK